MFAKSKILGVALATFVATSLMACSSGGEEKETRTIPSEWKAKEAKEDGMSVAVPKSYVRENKSVTPPFIAVFAGKDEKNEMFMVLADERSRKDIMDVKVNNGECNARYMGNEEDLAVAVGFHFCDIKQIELTTKAGKVTYKF